jgi:hypothetical protein
MATENPKVDREQGKRDTEGRPLLTDEDEKKRQDEEKKEKPVDPE